MGGCKKIETVGGYVTSGVIKHYFSLPTSSFEALVKQGMPHIRIGTSRRFRLTEVESWFAERAEAKQKLKEKNVQVPRKSPFAR